MHILIYTKWEYTYKSLTFPKVSSVFNHTFWLSTFKFCSAKTVNWSNCYVVYINRDWSRSKQYSQLGSFIYLGTGIYSDLTNLLPIDRIEYDVTIQIPARSMASVSMCARVPKKSNQEHCKLRASLMYAFKRAYGLPYKMATFIATKRLFYTVY